MMRIRQDCSWILWIMTLGVRMICEFESEACRAFKQLQIYYLVLNVCPEQNRADTTHADGRMLKYCYDVQSQL
jgi:hypothetical protein